MDNGFEIIGKQHVLEKDQAGGLLVSNFTYSDFSLGSVSIFNKVGHLQTLSL